MLMKKHILALFPIFFATAWLTVSAQNYQVVDIVELQNDLTARTNPRKDAHGKDCALIKANVPSIKKMSFSNCVGDVKYLPGEFDIYIPEGTKSIVFSSADASNNIIDFEKFGINVTSKSVYKATIKAVNTSRNKNCSLTISANMEGPIVLVDGIPSGQIPVTIHGLSAGEHVISIPNTLGYSCSDQTVVLKTGESTDLVLSLTPKLYQEIGIEWATPGGDTAGWWQVRTKKIKNNGKEGLTDFAGNILVPCEFDYVFPDWQGEFFHVRSDGKEGFYKPGVGLVIDCIYDDIFTNSDTNVKWYKVRDDEKVGYVDSKGKQVIPLIFTDGTWRDKTWNSSMIVARIDCESNDITGVFDASGHTIVEPRAATQCDYYDGVSVGYYESENTRRYFIMDTCGNETLLPHVDFIDGFMTEAMFHDGLLPVRNSSKKWGYINKAGELVIPFMYEYAGSFENGYGYVTFNGSNIYINKCGQKIGDNKTVSWSYAQKYGRKSMIKVTDGKLFGMMDEDGEIRIPIKYEDIEYDPYIEAKRNGEREIFDADANFLFSIPENMHIGHYDKENGILQIFDEESETYGFYNEKGEILSDCIYSMKCPSDDSGIIYDYESVAGTVQDGMAMLVIGDRFGFMNNKGQVTVPAIYSAALPFEDGSTFVRKQDGTWIKIDKNNNQIN